MKVVFISNYFNHHQKPFSDAMFALLGEDYKFIETQQMSEERKSMGWGISNYPSYVICSDYFESNRDKCEKLINQADAVIIGSAPRELLRDRIKSKKTIFRYSERPLKEKSPTWKYPFRLYTWRRLNPQRKNICMLCASAYTSADYAKFGLYKNRCYKWGYFTEVKEYGDIDGLIAQKEKNSILWVSRFLDWKHPEIPVEIAKRLKAEGYSFKLNMIGNGEQEKKIAELVKREALEDHVGLLGAMKPEKVREYMENSEIFLFTSDRHEGWGAVLNESMNSACAVASSHAIGSTPFLLKHGENGFVYKDGDVDDLYKNVKYLLDNSEKRAQLGKNAYKTMLEEWNPRIAAERFLTIAEKINQCDNADIYVSGPCSKSEKLKDDWIYDK